MTAAIKVIHGILTRDFGFEHVLWIFSGRRGVHCWVCDTRARKLSHDQRAAIVDFLSVYGGKEKKVILPGSQIHPSLMRAYEDLLPFFEDMLETQGWFATNEKTEKILDFISTDAMIRGEFQFDNEDDSGLQKWEELKRKVAAWLQKQGKKFSGAITAVRTSLIRIVFFHVYPRLDVNVSKHLNHLLKSPWVVHPKTGKVCVPIDPSKAAGFDCNAVPHILQLHEELNAAHNPADPQARATWKDTSLKPHIEYFREFVNKLLHASQEENPRAHIKTAGVAARKEIASDSTDW